jgi:hypothetical protein
MLPLMQALYAIELSCCWAIKETHCIIYTVNKSEILKLNCLGDGGRGFICRYFNVEMNSDLKSQCCWRRYLVWHRKGQQAVTIFCTQCILKQCVWALLPRRNSKNNSHIPRKTFRGAQLNLLLNGCQENLFVVRCFVCVTLYYEEKRWSMFPVFRWIFGFLRWFSKFQNSCIFIPRYLVGPLTMFCGNLAGKHCSEFWSVTLKAQR